jgi:hypothetical protein
MKDLSGGRRSVFVLYGSLIAAASSVLGALRIFLEITAGTGSHEGNILRMGLGFLLILISLLIFGAAAIYLKASDPRPGTSSGTRFDAHS